MSRISEKTADFFVGADKVCDYVPLLSFGSNCVNLLGKGILYTYDLATKNKNREHNNHYWEHIHKKGLVLAFSLWFL